MRAGALGSLCLIAWSGLGLVAAPGSVTSLAERTLGLSDGDWAMIDRGEAVVRALPSTVGHEVAVGGAIRVDAPARAVADLLRDVPRWKHGPAILQLGWFGAPPTPADVAALRLDTTDLDALRRCAGRPCDTKLAAFAPQAFRTFDWSAPDPRARAEALVRNGLLAYAVAYLARGDVTLFVYPSRRVSVAGELAELLQSPLYRPSFPPGLWRYLGSFPQNAPPGTFSSLYWARETFGFKPVLSLYHVVVHRPPGLADVFIATKQIFASRYIDASIELTAVGEDAQRAGAGCYVAYVAGSRTDSLRGFWGRMKRGPASRGAEDGVARLLARIERLAEGDDHR